MALAFSPSLRAWLTARGGDLLSWCGRGVTVPVWVLAVLGTLVVLTWASWLHQFRQTLRPADVRLFRSLSGLERQVMQHLANEDYGMSEGSLCELLPAPMQVHLHLIDRLVTELRLAERHEPEGGGAIWVLSGSGRRVAIANRLFRQAASQ